ncbi:MAG: YraN family protein [Eggerthellaceae bacterium]|nr:YraN family protein [Eggerthellaceae bacterium]
MHNVALGARGEEAAARFLERRGYSILERNWKCFAGEADIIAQDEDAIHFIEVKTRMGEGKGFPAEAVTAKKRQRYEAMAELFLETYDGCDTGITFDIISINVLGNDRAIMRLYRNVLSCDCR